MQSLSIGRELRGPAHRTGREVARQAKDPEGKSPHLIYIYIRCQGETAIHRRGEGDIWQGLYEPWLIEGETEIPDGVRLLAKNVKHVLTHRILTADFYLWETDARPVLPNDYFWIKEEDIDDYGIPRLIDILLGQLTR